MNIDIFLVKIYGLTFNVFNLLLRTALPNQCHVAPASQVRHSAMFSFLIVPNTALAGTA